MPTKKEVQEAHKAEKAALKKQQENDEKMKEIEKQRRR